MTDTEKLQAKLNATIQLLGKRCFELKYAEERISELEKQLAELSNMFENELGRLMMTINAPENDE